MDLIIIHEKVCVPPRSPFDFTLLKIQIPKKCLASQTVKQKKFKENLFTLNETSYVNTISFPCSTS